MGRNAGGRSGTLAPAASLVLLRGRERMGRARPGPGDPQNPTTGATLRRDPSRQPYDYDILRKKDYSTRRRISVSRSVSSSVSGSNVINSRHSTTAIPLTNRANTAGSRCGSCDSSSRTSERYSSIILEYLNCGCRSLTNIQKIGCRSRLPQWHNRHSERSGCARGRKSFSRTHRCRVSLPRRPDIRFPRKRRPPPSDLQRAEDSPPVSATCVVRTCHPHAARVLIGTRRRNPMPKNNGRSSARYQRVVQLNRFLPR